MHRPLELETRHHEALEARRRYLNQKATATTIIKHVRMLFARWCENNAGRVAPPLFAFTDLSETPLEHQVERCEIMAMPRYVKARRM
jgi:hypothetical protein